MQKAEKKNLLCVDDEEIVRQLCASALSDYQVKLATNGQEALDLLETEPFDIILSDIVMPKVNGLELLQTIKEQQPDKAVILMTGYTDKEIILKSLKAGADDFISKPINLLQLKTTVDKVIEKQKIRQELANLKQIDKLKSDFLGLISHKLKTPATAISLFIQNISGGIESPNDPNFRQMLALVQKETEHLEQLIQDLLYFSETTLQSETTALEPVSLAGAAEQAALAFNPAAADKNLELRTDMSALASLESLNLNPQQINFVFHALLDNAVKFTPPGGMVRLSGRLNDSHASVTITDNGIGIPATELGKIFEKFYQVDPEYTGQIRGFGLGLYYTRDFIHNMGGQIHISSQLGEGTEVTITFPLDHL